MAPRLGSTDHHVFNRLQGLNPRENRSLHQTTVSALMIDLPLLDFHLLMVLVLTGE
jgi:hypothetical protein